MLLGSPHGGSGNGGNSEFHPGDSFNVSTSNLKGDLSQGSVDNNSVETSPNTLKFHEYCNETTTIAIIPCEIWYRSKIVNIQQLQDNHNRLHHLVHRTDWVRFKQIRLACPLRDSHTSAGETILCTPSVPAAITVREYGNGGSLWALAARRKRHRFPLEETETLGPPVLIAPTTSDYIPPLSTYSPVTPPLGTSRAVQNPATKPERAGLVRQQSTTRSTESCNTTRIELVIRYISPTHQKSIAP
ncbi:hypothetical protein WN51_13995 [Melipona quadrifasciata]|uniref:Uncharacterized protein n=1 Tax=Melipona quadrifasciata TaxID=166423 RepID=A0A0M8ZZ74_9HYME|nr:hypothetical protein WN51_13995 [Melipona quadrifasciata]